MAQHSAFINFAQYAAARTFASLLGLFPVNANLGTARLIGSVMWRVDAKHRKRALENLAASFPEKSDAELRHIGERSVQNLMEFIMDTLFTPRMIHVETWHRYIHLDNLGESLKILLRQRGAIMLTAHYGNFEVLGYALATLGFETYSVARPIDNPLIDTWVLGVRERKGQVILSKRGVTTTAQDVLEKRGVLAFIADQNAGPKGMFVPFFGRQASAYKTIALLAIQYHVPIIIGYARRRGDRFEYDVGVQDIIYPEMWKSLPADVLANGGELRWITERWNKGIEDFIRGDPTQYWWLHRRWKSRPKGEEPGSVRGVG